jgi:hypothetical protein
VELISPSELIQTYIATSCDPTVLNPLNVVTGPLSHAQQQEGGVSLTDAGLPDIALDAPVIWLRSQMRIINPKLSTADTITRHVFSLVHRKNRIIALQPSNGHEYLIHVLYVTAGPSQHKDTEVSYEELMFANAMIGTEPVS